MGQVCGRRLLLSSLLRFAELRLILPATTRGRYGIFRRLPAPTLGHYSNDLVVHVDKDLGRFDCNVHRASQNSSHFASQICSIALCTDTQKRVNSCEDCNYGGDLWFALGSSLNSLADYPPSAALKSEHPPRLLLTHPSPSVCIDLHLTLDLANFLVLGRDVTSNDDVCYINLSHYHFYLHPDSPGS